MKYLLLCLFLVGCTTIKEVPVEIKKEPLKLEDPKMLDLKDFDIFLKEKDICITPASYKILAQNMQNIKSYIIQLRSEIKMYKEYYESN
jgi:hypothetical protein